VCIQCERRLGKLPDSVKKASGVPLRAE